MAEATMDQDALHELIVQMAEVKEAMNVQRDLLNALRREARSDGLNLQALNPLVEILGEDKFDRGSRVVSDLISYARAAGAELDLGEVSVSPNQSSTRPVEPDSGEHASFRTPSAATTHGRDSEFDGTWRSGRAVFHGALAMSISAVLLWLLH